MSATRSSSFPRILVIGGDDSLREFCREGLPWAGCVTEYARDVADAVSGEFRADVVVVDLPGGTSPATIRRVLEFADAHGSKVIALTDDLAIFGRPIAGAQVLFRPCPPETLWDALAIAIAERVGAERLD